MGHTVTLIPGDWIGPEVAEVAKAVIAAAGVDITWEEFDLGCDGIPSELLESCRQTGVILKGKVNAPRRLGSLPPTMMPL